MRRHSSTPDDAEAVSLVLTGRKAAFLTLLRRHQASVLGLCRQILHSESEAQDVVQEAILQAFLGLETLREPAHFGAWLHSIAANIARSRLRQKRRRPLLSLESLGGHSLGNDAGGSSERRSDRLLVDNAPGPEEVRLARELHDEVIEAIKGLSVANREAVVGYYLQGYSYAELAELLGVPVSTIKGRLHKGRKQLEPSLEQAARQVLGFAGKEKKTMNEEQMIEVTVEDALKMPFDDELGLRIMKAGGSLRELTDLVDAQSEDFRWSLIAIVLKEDGGERMLPVWIGLSEGLSIWSSISGREMPRPMTHDLMRELLTTVNLEVESVAVVRLVESTFYGEITLKKGDGGHRYRVDSRPSDAIALAVRLGAPIYAASTVLQEAAYESKQALLEAQRKGLGPFGK
jgi:RNA polymerase sigma factor (sigma-70 family)